MKKQIIFGLVLLGTMGVIKGIPVPVDPSRGPKRQGRVDTISTRGIQAPTQQNIDRMKKFFNERKVSHCSVASRVMTGGKQNAAQKAHYQKCLKNNGLPTSTPEDPKFTMIDSASFIKPEEKIPALLKIVEDHICTPSNFEIGRYSREPIAPVLPGTVKYFK